MARTKQSELELGNVNDTVEVAETETNKEEVTETVSKDAEVVADDNIIDIDLTATERRKFRINGDNNRLVELNQSDLTIVTRIEEAEKKLNLCIADLTKLIEEPSDTDEELYALGKKFKDRDNRMRELVDYIFQSNVSDVCVPQGQGSMYDPFNGKYRFEHIIDALITFYQSTIQNEYKRMRKVVEKKTAKYTKPKK